MPATLAAVQLLRASWAILRALTILPSSPHNFLATPLIVSAELKASIQPRKPLESLDIA